MQKKKSEEYMLLSFDKKEDLIRFLANDTSKTTYILMRGFQRLKRWTAIPLKPLTFLYGPNSAGKGAVFDCHCLLQTLLFQSGSTEFKEKLKRWHRHELDLPLSIGFSVPDWRSIWGDHFFDNNLDTYWATLDEWPTDILAFSTHDRHDAVPKRITWLVSLKSATSCVNENMELFVNDQMLARVSETSGTNSSLVIDTSVYKKNFMDAQPEFLERCERLPTGVQDGLVELAECDFLWPNLSELPMMYSVSGVVNDVNDVNGLLVMLFAAPLFGFCDISGYVGPIRKILSDEQLRFSFGKEKSAERQGALLEGVEGDGTDLWGYLAKSAFVHEFGGGHQGLFGYLFYRVNPGLLGEVNRWLSLPQFLGTGYQIVSDVRLSVPAKWFRAGASFQSADLLADEGLEAVVRLSLQDSEGRIAKLEDVGTGISQVIPVLISALKNANGNTKYFEQPELHLHPKLQTTLCDLFIEGKNHPDRTDSCSVIESHSEHMILRLLRRVRETSMADIQHHRFNVTPDEISILYFEPEGDESFVHLLRVSPDGTFVDRWPAGFFDERFEEMFNEQGGCG